MNLSKNLSLVLGLSMFTSFVYYMFAYSAWRDKWNAQYLNCIVNFSMSYLTVPLPMKENFYAKQLLVSLPLFLSRYIK